MLKSWNELEIHLQSKSPRFALGVGGAAIRHRLSEEVVSRGGHLCSIISNQALVGEWGNDLGIGICVLSHATITCDASLGQGTLVNKGVIISHDAQIGSYCDISPGAKILGRTMIGAVTEIGTEAVILPDIRVGTNCKVGAGAVVTKDVPDNTTVIGIPAKPLKTHKP